MATCQGPVARDDPNPEVGLELLKFLDNIPETAKLPLEPRALADLAGQPVRVDRHLGIGGVENHRLQLAERVQRELAIPALHITHHRGEAAQLADMVFRLEAGAVCETTLTDSP